MKTFGIIVLVLYLITVEERLIQTKKVFDESVKVFTEIETMIQTLDKQVKYNARY